VQVPAGAGTLAKLATKITELGGLILSVGSMSRESDSSRELIVKVTGVTKEDLIPAIESIGDHVVDAREV
jgi:acetoin utilization protein AcuB